MPTNAPPPSDPLTGKARTLTDILKLSNRLMAPFSTYLEHRHRISVNEFRMLMLIGHHEGAASHELAGMTGVNVMSVSRAITALQKHGRITVDRDPNNGRRKTLSLTDEGRRLFRIMRPRVDQVASYLLSGLSPDQVAQLDEILASLIATLEATDAEGRSVFMQETRPPDEEG